MQGTGRVIESTPVQSETSLASGTRAPARIRPPAVAGSSPHEVAEAGTPVPSDTYLTSAPTPPRIRPSMDAAARYEWTPVPSETSLANGAQSPRCIRPVVAAPGSLFPNHRVGEAMPVQSETTGRGAESVYPIRPAVDGAPPFVSGAILRHPPCQAQVQPSEVVTISVLDTLPGAKAVEQRSASQQSLCMVAVVMVLLATAMWLAHVCDYSASILVR